MNRYAEVIAGMRLQTKEERFAVMVDAGIFTPDGKLTPQYRGEDRMSNALVPTGFDPVTIGAVEKLARTVSSSNLLPKELREKPGDVMIIMLTGNELGLPPMLALQKVYVINGRPFVSSELLAAKVLASQVCQHFTLVESTEERATYETHRKGSPRAVTLTYSIKDAERAGLTNSPTWKNHRPAMLRARAAAALARAVYPDVIMGFDAMDQAEMDEERIAAARVVGTPAPVQQPRPAAPEPTDAEIVPDEGGQTDDEAIAFWTERMNEATTLAALEEVSAGLRQSKQSKAVRSALSPIYTARKAALVSGEVQQ